MTAREASTYARLDAVTLRRAVRRGQLRAWLVNGGSRIRYRAEDVDAYLTSHAAKGRE